MTEQCKEKIYANFITHQCERKATEDGYCWQHHPDAVKKRQEESDKRSAKKWQNSKFMQLQRANKKIEELVEQVDELEKESSSHWKRASLLGKDKRDLKNKLDRVDDLTVHEAGDLLIEELVIKLSDLNKILDRDNG